MKKPASKKPAVPATLQFCTELVHPDPAESLAVALRENPANLSPPPGPGPLHDAIAHMDAPFIGIVFRKVWRPGRTLRIAFMGNVNSTVRTKIKAYANQWLSHVNLRFSWVTGSAGDIRITTTPGGSWSYIGTDALARPAAEATMNFGWLTPTTPDDEYSRVVLHEFGHALGAIHEHQHPDAGVPWDRPAVYAYYARQGWSRAQVDSNIFARYAVSQLNASTYDRRSIMHYAVPNELTIGDWEVGWNRVLSARDKSHIRRLYP